MRRRTRDGRFCDRSSPLSPQLVDSTAIDPWAQEVVEQHADSPFATEAKTEIEKLKG